MLKSLLLAVILIIGSACHTSPSNKAERNTEEVTCKDIDAIDCVATSWQMFRNSQTFPAKMAMTLSNGKLVYNSCTNVGMNRVTLNTSSSLIFIDNMGLPGPGKLGFKIVDLGTNCTGNSVFFENNDVRFSLSNLNGKYLVVVDLDSP